MASRQPGKSPATVLAAESPTQMNAKPHRQESVAGEIWGTYCRSVSESIGFPGRQQIPKSCQSRNHGLLARVSSCLRFAAETSLALRGLMSGVSNISSSCRMSSIMRSTSIQSSIANQLCPTGRTAVRCTEPPASAKTSLAPANSLEK